MVKVRPGSRKGLTKLHRAVQKAHRRKARNVPTVPNPTLRAVWDLSQSPAHNLAKAGLQPKVNHIRRMRTEAMRTIEIPVVKIPTENPDVLTSLEKEASRPEEVKRVVRPGEEMALKRLERKYGDDYQCMARDLKLNYLQWTAPQLQKRIERMNNILAE